VDIEELAASVKWKKSPSVARVFNEALDMLPPAFERCFALSLPIPFAEVPNVCKTLASSDVRNANIYFTQRRQLVMNAGQTSLHNPSY
jgi:hypothetical protein